MSWFFLVFLWEITEAWHLMKTIIYIAEDLKIISHFYLSKKIYCI